MWVLFKLVLVAIKNILYFLQRFSAASKYFDALEDNSAPVDALEDWLSSPVVNTEQDPITYWTGMQAAGHPLAAMALDFMSIPGGKLFIWMRMSLIKKNVFVSNLHRCWACILSWRFDNFQASAFAIWQFCACGYYFGILVQVGRCDSERSYHWII